MHVRNDFNRKWLFSLDEIADSESPALDDSGWRELNVPHDWSIELPYDPVNSDGCVGYFQGGTGWYRKHFATPEGSTNKAVYVYFDGVYNHAHVYLNGHKLGYHPYGYSPFYFKLDDYLAPDGEDNVLAVMVDRTRYLDSRWYPGSGIYRAVELLVYDKVHFDIWPTFVTTPTNNKVVVQTKVVNERGAGQDVAAKIDVVDESGDVVANTTGVWKLQPGENGFTVKLNIDDPVLWDMGAPYLYKVVITLSEGDACIAENTTRFGIRQFGFDAEKGFILNGKSRKLKGVCLHHDAGLVGAAVPKDVWRRRLEILKEGGCNAIRTSHNPPSEEFLDLCDEMGLFVKHEFFDEWDYPKDKRDNGHEHHDDYLSRGYAEVFQEWGETDLKTSMLRDRNHPSIFMWSLGNEIELVYGRIMRVRKEGLYLLLGVTGENTREDNEFADDEGDYEFFSSAPFWTPEQVKQVYESLPAQEYSIDETGKRLAKWTREVDTTRPVTMNACIPSVTYETGLLHDLDMVGFSYRRTIYDYGKKYYPDIKMFGAENFTQWNDWKAVIERENIPGVFLWTGINYLGEAHSGWPRKASDSGLLDLGGFKKPVFHFFKALWDDDPYVYLATQPLAGVYPDMMKRFSDNPRMQPYGPYRLDDEGNVLETFDGAWNRRTWGWHPVNDHYNYEIEGEMTVAEVYTNCESVELFLDGESLGVKHLKDFEDRILKWAFPYKAGTLTAKAVGVDASDTKVTAGEPVQVRITADKTAINANYDDVVHVVAQLYDADGNIVRHADREVTFELSGPGVMLGVDNGAADNVQPYIANSLFTSQGRALTIVQANGEPGQVVILARMGESVSNVVTVKIG